MNEPKAAESDPTNPVPLHVDNVNRSVWLLKVRMLHLADFEVTEILQKVISSIYWVPGAKLCGKTVEI